MFDSLRGAADGIVHATAQTVSLLVAIKVFGVADHLAALIAASPFIGNFLSLFYSAHFSRSRRGKALLAAAPVALCAALLVAAAWMPSALGFTLAVTLGVVFFTLRVPFLTAIYHENYAPTQRGVLFSRGLLFSIGTSLVASFAFGSALDTDLGNYRVVLVVAGCAAVLSFLFVRAIPASPPQARGMANPLRNLGLVRRDRAFGYILFVWFVFGFANLWVAPLRVVYLAEPERGLNLSPLTVLVIQGVIVETARLLFTPLWAKLFDRMNFVVLRMILNFFLAAGLLLFFITDSPIVIGIGSFLSGVGYAGGGIAWHLWVTRFAPAQETHVYMSVHTFLTGLRGFVGPYLGFLFVRHFSIHTIGLVSCGLVVLSVLLLVPAIGRGAPRAERA